MLKKILTRLVFLLLSLSFGASQSAFARELPLERIKLPPGFKINLYAQVPGARSLAKGGNGTVFVGTRDEGKVYALLNGNRKPAAETVITVAAGLDTPNGVSCLGDSLYVAERSRILRFDGISDPRNVGKPAVVADKFPRERAHGWKFIGFGPDQKLYVPVGAPCNICEPENEIFATITRMNADGSGLEIFARGVRNTVGFDWHPVTRELWFTENGRDWMGDDQPPDELNRAEKMGLDFGYPYCHGGDLPDPRFGKKHSCSEFIPPAIKLGPHVAALGMRFYTGETFPALYRNQVFIAEHGSWNRSVPIGYRISLVRLKGNRATSYKVFAAGWLHGGSAWGRPVDVLVYEDGSLLVSDDQAGVVYRISYSGGEK